MWIRAWLRQLRWSLGFDVCRSCIACMAWPYLVNQGSLAAIDCTSRLIRGLAARDFVRMNGAATTVAAPAMNPRRASMGGLPRCASHVLRAVSAGLTAVGFDDTTGWTYILRFKVKVHSVA